MKFSYCKQLIIKATKYGIKSLIGKNDLKVLTILLLHKHFLPSTTTINEK